jgi:predicted metalloprotease with PDZ domain
MFKRVLAFGVLGVLPVLGAGCPCCSSRADEAKPTTAALGAETRIPTGEEAKAYGLSRHKLTLPPGFVMTGVGCTNGQYVKAVERDGPADKAGLKQGDVILSLDSNKLYSRDDLADFLRVMKPGAKVRALVKRARTFKEEKVTLTLGTGPELSGKGIVWQHAGLSQLDAALTAAKKDRKLVLVGLSGGDT